MTKLTQYTVEVSDSALMHLCLMGLESYHSPGGYKETYGVLWGTSSYREYKKESEGSDAILYHYRIEHAITDIGAERSEDEVGSDQYNLKLKKDVIEECWPALSLLGDFHTHPYGDREEARGGGRLSEGDRYDIEESGNRKFWFKMDLKVNLVMSIFSLGNAGSKDPVRIKDKNHIVEWTLRSRAREEYYRLRLAAYVINKVPDGRRYSLILTPREHDWDNGWIKKRGLAVPKQKIWLDIPSVLGTYNFWEG